MVCPKPASADQVWDSHMKLAACGTLKRLPENQVWYRAAQPQYFATALATAHTSTVPSRFNTGTPAHPTFRVLYFSENHQLALFEVEAMFGSPHRKIIVPNPRQARMVLNIQVTLQEVA